MGASSSRNRWQAARSFSWVLCQVLGRIGIGGAGGSAGPDCLACLACLACFLVELRDMPPVFCFVVWFCFFTDQNKKEHAKQLTTKQMEHEQVGQPDPANQFVIDLREVGLDLAMYGQSEDDEIAEQLLADAEATLQSATPTEISNSNQHRQQDQASQTTQTGQSLQSGHEPGPVNINTEDCLLLRSIVESLLKYEAELYGEMVVLFWQCGSVGAGIRYSLQHCRSRLVELFCNMNRGAVRFFARDFGQHIVDESITSNESTVFQMDFPSGITMHLICNHKDVPDAASTCNKFRWTTRDLLVLVRTGFIVLHVPESLRHCASPLLRVHDDIQQFSYSWLRLARLDFEQHNKKAVYKRWSALMQRGIYNKDCAWTFPTAQQLAKHLLEENCSCGICLGQEDDASLQFVLETAKAAGTVRTSRVSDQPDHGPATRPESDQPDRGPATRPEPEHQELVQALQAKLDWSHCRVFMALPCRHIMHTKCFAQIRPCPDTFVLRCPLCRKDYDLFDL
jgi:hypothetical protein